MRLFGHPVHPLVVAFPIALLVLTPLWDGAALLGIAPELALVGYWSELAGLVGGGLALVTGLMDFLTLKEPPPELTNAALRHAAFALATLGLYVTAFVVRGGASGSVRPLVLGLEIVGALGLGATGWLGGHLVFRHGVGVGFKKE
jgi:uncharacterized membrane protein